MGSQGMMSSPQGYGCMGLTAFYGKATPEDAALEVLQKAYDLGVTHFDTAEMYTGKDEDGNTLYNETLVGKFAAKVGKDKISVATKYFPTPDKAECTEEQVRSSLDASLKNLGYDCVDLYYLHRIPKSEDNKGLKSWMEAVKQLVSEGKVKYVGLSEATPAQIKIAHTIHPITAVQQEWSLITRNLEADVVPTCRELGIAIVAYSPLCRGFTSGKVKTNEDWDKIGSGVDGAPKFQLMCPHLSGDNLEANAGLLSPLEKAAAAQDVAPSELSLAWVQAQGPDVFPIPGTTKIVNLESNVKAVKLSNSIDTSVFKALGESVDFKQVQGNRYPDMFMPMSYECNL